MRLCRGSHEILMLEEPTGMGAVVSCLSCGDTFHMNQSTLEEKFFHAHHISANGPDHDREFFIHHRLIDNV